MDKRFLKAVNALHDSAVSNKVFFAPGIRYDIIRNPYASWMPIDESKVQERVEVPVYGQLDQTKFNFERLSGIEILANQTQRSSTGIKLMELNFSLLSMLGLEDDAKEDFSIYDNESLQLYLQKTPFVSVDNLYQKYNISDQQSIRNREKELINRINPKNSLSELVCSVPKGNLIYGESAFTSQGDRWIGKYLLKPFNKYEGIYEVIRAVFF